MDLCAKLFNDQKVFNDICRGSKFNLVSKERRANIKLWYINCLDRVVFNSEHLKNNFFNKKLEKYSKQNIYTKQGLRERYEGTLSSLFSEKMKQ